jgi:hypothetical protein
MNSKIHDIPNKRTGIVAKKDVLVNLHVSIEHSFIKIV